MKRAANQIQQAIDLLKLAKIGLSQAKSSQTIRLVTVISELEEIQGIVTDPECN